MKTVLIADDSPLILKTLEFRIKSAGYRVVTALDPSEALEKVRAETPDVIIMDINFPPDVGFGGGGTWDGYRVLEWMKMNKSLGDAIQIIITGDDIAQHQEKAAASGVKGLFQKPIDIKALLGRIAECLPQPAVST
jgi:CheY-like chemotaxis protein